MPRPVTEAHGGGGRGCRQRRISAQPALSGQQVLRDEVMRQSALALGPQIREGLAAVDPKQFVYRFRAIHAGVPSFVLGSKDGIVQLSGFCCRVPVTTPALVGHGFAHQQQSEDLKS